MICNVTDKEYPELVSVWESSVKATHPFLSKDDFNFYKKLIPAFLDNVQL